MFHHGCGLTRMNISMCPSLNNTLTGLPSRQDVSFNLVVELYLIGLVCLVGIFGNVVTIVVLCRDKERRKALLLLQALAVADGLYLIVALLRYPLKYIMPVYRDYILMQPVVFPMLKTCQTITIWTMVLVTIDRYIYVCKPFHALQMFNNRARRAAGGSLFILGLFYNLPRYFDSCIVEWFNPCDNSTLTRSVTRSQFHHHLYYDIYQQGAYIVLLYVLPLVILAYMNARLVQAIHRSKRRHGHHNYSREYGGNNATIVLVIIVLVFIVCETPELFLRLATVMERKTQSAMFSKKFSAGLMKFNVISQLLLVINSSVNFFVYLIFGRRFRIVMKETFIVRFSTTATLVPHESVPLQRQPLNHIREHFIRNK